MEKFTCPWDESGNLIPGVTVREYAMFIKNNGGSGNFSINGTLYDLHSLLIAPPDDVDLDAVVIAHDDGYYGNPGVKTKNDFKSLRESSGMSKKRFSEFFEIPYRTVQNWDAGINKCPDYLLNLMEYKLNHEK